MSGPGNGALDLSQFFEVFFEEASENLERMEQLLLGIDLGAADDETLNAIFRCAHSVKGGAATFGFAELAELTHEMETLLDRLRRHELEPDAAMVDVLLEAGDALRAQLAERQQGRSAAAVDDAALRDRLRGLAEGRTAPAVADDAPRGSGAVTGVHAPEAPPATPAVTQVEATAGSPAEQSSQPKGATRILELVVGPLDSPEQADNLLELFREIDGLGTIDRLDAGHAADGMRRFRIVTASSDDDLLDLFTFHVDRGLLDLQPIGPGYGFHEGAPGAPAPCAAAAAGSAADSGTVRHESDPGANTTAAAPDAVGVGAHQAGHAGAAAGQPGGAARTTGSEASTLRVSVEKVDQLINLVGELVITQAMLAQNSVRIDPALHEQLIAGLGDLERNTRNLQESVMSIRMIPMSTVFSRFPRMLRDLAGRLGKKVDFVTRGEATELDKGLVEKIIDPLTHLVRNSCDHGIESPEQRRASGKSETGTISLSASHEGGSIVIEVCDDGRGLSRTKLLAKARERGIEASESMSDADVWNLVFAPGFSTAESVTDVSGRGVGMDVVKKNITQLGGSVDIDSCEGRGMSVKVRLPLTLAIMDGMSVAVGMDCYIVPLASVVESFQLREETMRAIGGGGRVVQVRDEYLPLVDLRQLFAVPPDESGDGIPIAVVTESEGRRVALTVDALIGQQQVVVKNLEANYRKVDGISGATIMGDGRVALILDIGSLCAQERRRSAEDRIDEPSLRAAAPASIPAPAPAQLILSEETRS